MHGINTTFAYRNGFGGSDGGINLPAEYCSSIRSKNWTVLHNECNQNDEDFPILDTKSIFSPILLKGARSYGFLACSDPVDPPTSLNALLFVYTLPVWVMTLCTMIFLGVFVHVTLTLKIPGKTSLLSNLTSGLNILLEQESKIGANDLREPYLYPVCATWLLMFLIVTNSLRGDNITKTIIVPAQTIPFENFSQLIDHKFSFVDQVAARMNKYFNGSEYVLMYKHMIEMSLSTNAFVGVASNKTIEHLDAHILGVDRPIAHEKNLWQYMKSNRHYGIWLSEFPCEKIAYLGRISDIEEAKLFLEKNHPQKVYSVGKEFITFQNFGWRLKNFVNPDVFIRIKGLVTSGILGRWIWYEEMAKTLRNRIPVEQGDQLERSLKLEGNLSELFKLLGIVLGSCLIVLLGEIGYTIYQRGLWETWVMKCLVNLKQFLDGQLRGLYKFRAGLGQLCGKFCCLRERPKPFRANLDKRWLS